MNYRDNKVGKLIGGIVIGLISAVLIGFVVVGIASAVNEVSIGQQIVDWFGNSNTAETVIDTVANN